MTERLQAEMRALVDAPPVPPTPVAAVAERAGALRRRRWAALATAVVGGMALIGAARFLVAEPTGSSELVAGGADGRTASYVAERPGGYVATGRWHLTIRRGQQVMRLSNDDSPPCRPVGFIHAGDEVRGTVAGPGSRLRVGEHAGC